MEVLGVQRRNRKRQAQVLAQTLQSSPEELANLKSTQSLMDNISYMKDLGAEDANLNRCTFGQGELLKERMLHRIQSDGMEKRFYSDLTK